MQIRKTAGPWVAFIAALLFTEHVIVPGVYHALPLEYKQWDRTTVREETIREQPDYDVLFLGDSAAVLSASPEVFTAVTGLSAYNFATSADRNAVSDIFLLMEYLDRHPAPKAVIMVRSIHSWSRGQGGYELIRQQMERPDLARILYRTGVLTTPQYARVLADVLLPSLSWRERFAHVRRAAFHPEARLENIDMHDTSVGFNGFEPFDENRHETHLEMDERNREGLRQVHDGQGNPNQDPTVLKLVGELCRFSADRGIPLYLTMGPNARPVFEDPMVLSAMRGIDNQVRQLFDGEPLCTLISGAWILEDPYMSDITHPNAQGAVLFTQQIAEEFLQRQRRP